MKRTGVLCFAAALMLALAACGSGEKDPPEIPGSYAPAGLLPNDTYTLNENGSYQYGEEKGTYTVNEENGSLAFQPKDGTPYTLTPSNGYYYTEVSMSEDTEYGMAPSFDEDGHSNQTFTAKTGDTTLTLELHEDGNYLFSYSQASPVSTELTDVVSYEGSYALEEDVLRLDWKGHSIPFPFVNDAIYPVAYAKVTEENRADMEAMQAAVQTAAEEAAQGRWWTLADEETAAAVRGALVGTWEYTDGYGTYQYTFSDTGVSVSMGFLGMSVLNSSGTYTIHNGAILLEYQSQSGGYTIINHRAIPYTFADGSLTLYEQLDVMNEDGLLDPAANLTAISSYSYQKVS